MGSLRRAGLRVALLGVMAALALGAPVALAPRGFAQTTYQEADVKAVLVARVIGFIRWADEPASGSSRPLSLTVLGDPALAARLSVLRTSPAFRDRPFQVRGVESVDAVERCDVLFIGGPHSARLEEILAGLGAARTLTMADTPGAALRGVAVNLYPNERRMRLEINPRALKRAGLTASYQLMNLARVVPPPGDKP